MWLHIVRVVGRVAVQGFGGLGINKAVFGDWGVMRLILSEMMGKNREFRGDFRGFPGRKSGISLPEMPENGAQVARLAAWKSGFSL